MFVHPAQVAAIVARHPEIGKARLVVDNAEGTDRMTLEVEIPDNRSSSAEAIVLSIRDGPSCAGSRVRAPGECATTAR
jgi:phenylacetate-CoA ligase